ncbi:DMT family transporter [Hydrogenovibrio kuenenii]|uniref:DMT family transporter n=1 Tax=Hydrogenovibrio kuenenii TaxID=63658 RepID=UPI00046328F0|nr:DMT family transporter [Hydrogenovibrio kuenenii]
MNVSIAYFLVILIWSTTPLAIQWSGHQDWFFGIAARILISAIIVIPLVFIFGKAKFSLKPSALKVYAAASLGMLGGMTPIYYAAQTMPSGWISIIFGLTPILMGIFSYFLLKNFTLTSNKILGIIISFAGLIVIFSPHLNWQSSLALQGLLFALLGTSFHSLSTVLVKRLNHEVPHSHVVAGTVWISAVVYTLFHPSYIMEFPGMDIKALGAIFYLGSIGSVFGFILYYYILKRLDAVRIGLITLITPIVAVLLGHFLNNEPLDAIILLGVLLVISGLVVYEFGHKIRKPKH